jgi:hypothetical protein
MKPKKLKFTQYYIQDNRGYGLHYIHGKCYWCGLENWEELIDTTRFCSIAAAEEFIIKRDIKTLAGYRPTVGKFITKIGIN